MKPNPQTTPNLDMWIPSLPEGWMVHGLQNYYVDGLSKWKATIYRPMGHSASSCAVGTSPREAILRALDLRELANV